MIKTVFFAVVTLTGLTVSVPAQLRVSAQLGRYANVSVNLGRYRVPAPRYRVRSPRLYPRPVPVVRGISQVRRYTTVRRRYWVPGYQRLILVPARYGWTLDSCGVRGWGVVVPAHNRTVRQPGRWAYRSERVRVGGY